MSERESGASAPGQLPLNSSCNGHAECAGVQSDFISLPGLSDRAYITRAFLLEAVTSGFPHCSRLRPGAVLVRSFSLHFFRPLRRIRRFSLIRTACAGAH